MRGRKQIQRNLKDVYGVNLPPFAQNLRKEIEMKFKDLTLSTFSSAFRRIRNKKGLNKNKDKGVKDEK